ncbi:MAG: hypothetical protein JWL84_3846 [Rhodospirillales bacterium]|nr:hypothetical protein [Rhodospirillales bacterium]
MFQFERPLQPRVIPAKAGIHPSESAMSVQ